MGDTPSLIRNKEHKVVRDNVLFELGLFIGKLGRDRTFFVKPREIEDFHIATDLTGITAGEYSIRRSDNNLLAALGPFCNKVRRSIKNYNEAILLGFDDESISIRSIVIKKPDFWELKLVEQLLTSRLIPINHLYYNLTNNLTFESKKLVTSSVALDIIIVKLTEITKLYELIQRNLTEEQDKALGEIGEAGDANLIKNSIDTLIDYCRELLSIELELQSIKVENPIDEILDLFRGITREIIDCVNEYASQIKEKCNWDYLNKNNKIIDIKITLEPSENIPKILKLMEQYTNNPGLLS